MLRSSIARILGLLILVAGAGCGGSDNNQAVTSSATTETANSAAESPELLAIRRDLEGGKTKEVSAALTKLLADTPNDGRLLALRARLELQLGQRSAAIKTIAEAIEQEPQLADAWSANGEIQMLGGDFASAETSFSKSLELRPNEPRTLYARAMTRAAANRLDDSLQDFATAAQAQPDQPALFFANRATLLMRLKKPAEALLDARMAVTRSGSDADMAARAYGLVIQAAVALKDLQTAVSACDSLVQLAPKQVDFRLLRARVLREAGDEKAAVADESTAQAMSLLGRVEQGLASIPDNAALYRKRGLLRLELGEKPESTLSDFDAAVRLRPDDPEMYLARCAVWFRTNDFERVEQECRSAIEVRDVPAIHAVLGDLRLLQNEPELAIEEYRRARRFDGNVARAYRLRAKLRQNEGDFVGAKADIQQASYLEGDEPESDAASGVRPAAFDSDSDRIDEAAAAVSDGDAEDLPPENGAPNRN